ncbi:hypothetical protein OPT61_g2802 [Boeremia exigua]|uniref:Uncharacterized protein n=1 Tax=Boeremia exigua TaxID=749465 RepID=A0ACC2IKE9_9PLEO|nr:hypothetical protein OPT61_g2802 [Boeremia exigua]
MSPRDTGEDARPLRYKKLDYVTSPSIRVIVGPEGSHQKEFFVHQALICGRSEFFSKAMSGQWKEAASREVPLPEDEPDVFALYLKLLYSNQLPVKQEETVPREDLAKQYLVLGKLYVLAEKLIDEITKHIALTAISSCANEPTNEGICPELDTVRIIYDGTPPNSPARLLLIQLYTDFGDPSMFEHEGSGHHRDCFPKDFLFDLSFSLLDNRALPELAERARIEKEFAQMLEATKARLRRLEESQAEILLSPPSLLSIASSVSSALSSSTVRLAPRRRGRRGTQG